MVAVLAAASVILLSGCTTSIGATTINQSRVSFVLVQRTSGQARAWEVRAGAAGRTDAYGGARLTLMTQDCEIATSLSGYVGGEIVLEIDADGSFHQRQDAEPEPGLAQLPATVACTTEAP